MPNRSSSKRAQAFIALVALLALPLGFLAYYHGKFGIQPLPLGERIPPFVVWTVQGFPVSFAGYQGKKCMLVFFKVECDHCRNELLNLNALYSKYSSGIDFIVISLSEAEETKRYTIERHFLFPIFRQEPKVARDVFKIVVVPALLLVDEKQTLRQRHFGEQDLGESESTLRTFANNL